MKWLFAACLALFFITGLHAGVILERKVLFPAYNKPAAQAPGTSITNNVTAGNAGETRPPQADLAPPAQHQANRERFLDHLQQELDLSDDQLKQVGSMLDAHEQEFESTRQSIKEKLDALNVVLYKKIQAILKEDQKPRFEEKFDDWLKGGRSPQGPEGAGPERMRPSPRNGFGPPPPGGPPPPR